MSDTAFYIVTPSFNSARYVDDAIESVAGQAGNFEIFYHVQDGGSSDGTLEKLADWERRIETGAFPRSCSGLHFSFSSAPDQGMYQAINRGFAALAPSPHGAMTWLNSDDRLLPGAFAFVAAGFATFPEVRLVGGRPCQMDASGAIVLIHDLQVYPDRTLAAGVHDGDRLPFVMQEGTFWRAPLWFECGGCREDLRLAGDFDLWRRMAASCSYVSADTILGAHRKHDGQLSQDRVAYQKEVVAALSGEFAKRDDEWRSFQDWYVRSVENRDSRYDGLVLSYSSSQACWFLERRSPTAPLNTMVYLNHRGPVAAVPARFVSGFGAEGDGFPHLNLSKGHRLVKSETALLSFDVPSGGAWRIFLRFRNFTGSLFVTLMHRQRVLFTGEAPVTSHGRDGLIEAATTFEKGLNTMTLQLKPDPAAAPGFMVLSCEAAAA